MIKAYIRADYNLEILGQKWRALTNFLALRYRQNLLLGKNNDVLLTIATSVKNWDWQKMRLRGVFLPLVRKLPAKLSCLHPPHHGVR